MSAHFLNDGEAAFFVWECDGCGDSTSCCLDGAPWFQWATVCVHDQAFHFCSSSCLWAWNGHEPWGDDFGGRPGEVVDKEMPF